MKAFINANIITMDPDNMNATAMVVEDGTIIAIGTNEEIHKSLNYGEEIIDLKGGTIIPGFNDSHVHFLKGGQASKFLDLSTAKSHEDIIRIGKEYIKNNKLPENQWVIGRGWDENYLSERKPLLKNTLDKISTSHPIAFTRSCEHAVAANSKAIEMAGVNAATQQPEGGEVCTFDDGEPNGLFKDIARDLIYDTIDEPDKHAIKEILKEAIHIALKNGITSVQTDDFWSISSKDYQKIIDAYRELEEEGELKVRVYEQCVLETPKALKAFIDDGYMTGYGTNFFKIGPFKMFTDGAVGVRSAYLYESYSDDEGNFGSLIFKKETMDEMMGCAAKNGMQLTAHAIGDKASEVCLDSFEKANKMGTCGRPSIIHAHLLTPALLRRYANDNIITIGDPVAIIDDIPMYQTRLGKARERYSYNYKTLLDHGGKLALSTDWPINPISPFRNLYTIVTRKTPTGFPAGGWIPEEKISLKEALYAYTCGSAYCSFEEGKKGSLSKGKLADFIHISHDILNLDIEQLPNISVLETYVGGELCYSAV